MALPNPTPTPTPTPSPSASGQIAVANNAVKNHAEVAQKSPQVMADAIATGDPNAVTSVAATQTIAAHAQALQDHIDQYNSQSTWAKILGGATNVFTRALNILISPVGSVAKPLMTWANKPLNETQKDYKFLHSVYTDHSTWEGAIATLGVAAGAYVGRALGPQGAALGADTAASIERNIAKLIPNFQDSLAKSEDPNYLVSPGRDVSNLLSQAPGFGGLKDTEHGYGQTISGVTDAIFDFKADPLINAGKINSALKAGKYVGAAVDDAGKTIVNEAGKPVKAVATLPIAAQSQAVNDFIVSYANKAYTSGQVFAAYENPLNASFRRAVDTIAQTDNPVEIQRLFPRSEFTIYEANKLAKAKTADEVLGEMGKSLFSKELLEADYAPRTTLILPTQTWARALVDRGLEKLRQQGTTLNTERNLLLPKTVSVIDNAGNLVYNTDGSIKKQTLWGAAPTALAKLGLFDISGAKEAALNGLAGKVRTFTGYKALSVNPKTLEQSAAEFSWTDPALATQIHNMAMYAMPYDLALEHVAKIMLEPDLAEKQLMYGNLVKEIVKNAGLPADDEIVNRVMSQAQRATDGGELAMSNYGHDVAGAPRGYVEFEDGKKQAVAMSEWQQGSMAFMNFKQLRKAMRDTTIHSVLYQKADDWYTFYTDKLFAPITLFTTGFGLRVAGSEALHQVVRTGLGDYVKNRIRVSGAKYAAKYGDDALLNESEVSRYSDSVMQALTDEDRAALGTNKTIKGNSIAKMAKEKVAIYKELSSVEKANELLTDVRDLTRRVNPMGLVASKVAPYLAEDKFDTIYKFQRTYGARGVTAGVASDHGKSFKLNADDRVNILAQLQGRPSRPGEEIASLDGTHSHYHDFWALNLSKARNEAMDKDIISDWFARSKQSGWANLSNDEKWGLVKQDFEKRVSDINQYKDLRPTMVAFQAKPASFANEKVEITRGMFEGADGTIHEDLMRNVLNGERTYSKDLKNIPTTSSPRQVLGKSLKPAVNNPYERLLDRGYRTFVNPIIDWLSREPIFAHYLHQNFLDYKPMLDSGLISEQDALRFSAQKATNQMLPLIHNPALRSQWATLSRNIFPFYFAQEQAMKRVGRVGLQDGRAIQAFREFQMIHQGVNNPGFVHTDSNGKKYIVYPMVGEVGNGILRVLQGLGIDSASGMPTSVTGSTLSLGTVLPEAKVPGISPIANVAITDLAKHFPWMEKAANFASGGFPATNWLNTVMPNTAIRSFWNAMTMDQRQSAVANATLTAMASAYFHGIMPDNYAQLPADKQQEILDRIENNAKSNLIIQGILGFLLPLSPTVTNMDYNRDLKSLRSEYQDMIKQEQAKNNPDAIAAAKERFLHEHGSSSVSYTVGFSTNQATTQLPISQATIDWLTTNKDLTDKYPMGAAYLVPQNTSGGDIQAIENKLLAMHIRSKPTKEEFVNSVYIQKGWADLGQSYTDYVNVLKQAKLSNNINLISQASQAWKTLTEDYAKQNPIWWASYKDPTKAIDAENALSQLQAISTAGQLGVSKQSQGIQGLLTSYADYHSALQSQTKGTKYTAQGYQLIDIWNEYLDQEMASNPELTNVINGVFRRVN